MKSMLLLSYRRFNVLSSYPSVHIFIPAHDVAEWPADLLAKIQIFGGFSPSFAPTKKTESTQMRQKMPTNMVILLGRFHIFSLCGT